MLFFRQTVLLISLLIGNSRQSCFGKLELKAIPGDHVYHTLLKPVVVGHAGDVLRHQENSLEGVMSLVEIEADGIHMQVTLTEDNQLILFGDANLFRMTGENYNVRDLPYSEIKRMNLQKNILYKFSDTLKVTTRRYGSTTKIPLLSAVLEAVKKYKDKLIYIELVPGDVPPRDALDRHMSSVMARRVGDMVKRHSVRNQVLLVSRDAIKVFWLAVYHPDLPIAWWPQTELFRDDVANEMRTQYVDLPSIYRHSCFANTKNGSVFTRFLLTSGMISKAVNASFIDIPLRLLLEEDAYLKNDPVQLFKTNYGADISVGAFNVFPMYEKRVSKDADIMLMKKLHDAGISRLFTQNVNRVKSALKLNVIESGSIALLGSRLLVLLVGVAVYALFMFL